MDSGNDTFEIVAFFAFLALVIMSPVIGEWIFKKLHRLNIRAWAHEKLHEGKKVTFKDDGYVYAEDKNGNIERVKYRVH